MQSVENGISTARVESARVSRIARYRVSAAVLAGLLVVVGLATAWNLEGWPGRVDDDEGTYVAQAWAIIYEHTLTHYSYWYDHPPLGWAQIALFAWVTDGFNRVAAAVFVGRQFMWCVTLISCVLLYVLCRRLAMRRTTSAITVLLFGLSPLAQYFHRLVSLDNIEMLWVLAALVAATSPRRGWGPACRTGACAAIAVLSKETAIILLPVIAWVLWQHTGADDPAVDVTTARVTAAGVPVAHVPGSDVTARDVPATYVPGVDLAAAEAIAAEAAYRVGAAGGTGAGAGTAPPVWMPDLSAFAGRHSGDLRRLRGRLHGATLFRGPAPLFRAPAALRALPIRARRLLVFAATGCAIVAIYPIYALQRGQLSLLWSTLIWQFFNRPSSGSLLDTSSVTYSMVHGWVTTDPWLLITGFLAAVLMLASRRLRPFAFALLLQVVVLFKNSYLPFFYVTAIIPFAALAIGGAADTFWTRIDPSRLAAWAGRLGISGRPGISGPRTRPRETGLARRAWGYAPYAGRAVVALLALTYAIHVVPEWVSALDANSSARGDAPYLAAVTWAERDVPKRDTVVVDDYLWVDLKRRGLSPLWLWKISSQTAPDGWKSIQYIILQPQSAGTLAGMPALEGAYAHSVLVKNFGGGLTARRVIGAG
jgi:hypothetical protein